MRLGYSQCEYLMTHSKLKHNQQIVKERIERWVDIIEAKPSKNRPFSWPVMISVRS